MTTVMNIHKDSFMFMEVLCHVYDSSMSVLFTPLKIKCYPSVNLVF